MNVRDRLARMESRAQRTAEQIKGVDDRVGQVEKNTARIEALEANVSALLAVVKIKGK